MVVIRDNGLLVGASSKCGSLPSGSYPRLRSMIKHLLPTIQHIESPDAGHGQFHTKENILGTILAHALPAEIRHVRMLSLTRQVDGPGRVQRRKVKVDKKSKTIRLLGPEKM